jgi:hydrogenase nickel incorporation protein HypA/HybF
MNFMLRRLPDRTGSAPISGAIIGAGRSARNTAAAGRRARMHELSICQGLLGILEDIARREGATRICKVRLRFGALAFVEPQALEFAFEAVTRGSVAEGAELVFEIQPAEAHCDTCGHDFPVEARAVPCPRCGGNRIAVRGGTAMQVVGLEVV